MTRARFVERSDLLARIESLIGSGGRFDPLHEALDAGHVVIAELLGIKRRDRRTGFDGLASEAVERAVGELLGTDLFSRR